MANSITVRFALVIEWLREVFDMQAFVNATFLSCEERNRIFKVLIEDGGRILYTGDEIPAKYDGIPIVDLGGAAVVPAFADTHMHFESYALFRNTVDVRGAGDFAEMGEMLRRHIKRHRGIKFLPAYGCSAHTVREKRLPERADLDRMTSLPLLIVKYDGHAAVANSALIAQFPENVTGDPGFNPETGWLFQNAFYQGVNYITSKVSLFSIIKGMDEAAQELAERGIGLVHTAEGVGFKYDADIDMMRFLRYGLAPAFRIYFQTMDVAKITKRKLPGIGGCFALALDGCFGSEDARLLEPYSNNPDNLGFFAYSQEQVTDFCKEANRAGLQIAMHAIGDAAVEMALNAYEAALSDYPRKDARHIIIHADLIPEEMQERAAAHGIHIALQPDFLRWPEEPQEYLEQILGERADRLLPLRPMREKGLILSAGSDAPCTIPDPIESIWNCVCHPNPEYAVDVLEALRIHTLRAAETSFDEGRRGSLREGMIADFVLLDRNPLDVPKEELRDLKVLGTYFAGRRFVRKKRSVAAVLFAAAKNYFTAKAFN